MKKSRLSIFAVIPVIGLLILLAVLQYRQLGQISDGEKEQLQDFYFVGQDEEPLRYDFERRTFALTDLTNELSEIKELLKQNVYSTGLNPLIINSYTLLLANRAEGREVNIGAGIPQIESKLSGYLAIKLDEKSVEQIIADLNKRYFSDGANSDYNLLITGDRQGQIIFRNGENVIGKDEADAAVRLFDLSVSNYFVAVNSQIISRNQNKSKNVALLQKSGDDKLPPLPLIDKKDSLKVQLGNAGKNPETENKGVWLLTIRHREGSLENFINAARRENLAISFSILGLLGVSIILIFLSAHRARMLAQRQLDFVSAVSHEFRTPLAVIYSAGENLTDGVVNSQNQIEKYGGLIKREGRKLSGMVEQILEFAGAGSGRQKYDFRNVEIKKIIDHALAECRSLIEEKHFEVESDVAENLPLISADEKALSRMIQNLITNALKYSGSKHALKISANEDGRQIKISVEDRGIGIAPKDLRYIFQPFYRVKEVVDAQIHGNGLGLNLVKQIVEAHGGKIEVESKIRQGSKFTIHLPVII